MNAESARKIFLAARVGRTGRQSSIQKTPSTAPPSTPHSGHTHHLCQGVWKWRRENSGLKAPLYGWGVSWERVGRTMCAHDSQGGEGSPKGHSRRLQEAERPGAGRGGKEGVRGYAEILGKREGQHLRNPPPAAAAAASLRPGELSARPTRLPERRQPPAALAPRRRAARASGAQHWDPDWGWGDEPRPRRGPPPGPALTPRQGQVSGCGTLERERGEAGR